MRSLLIEFQRFNNLSTGSLRQGDPYLIAIGPQPVSQFTMPLDHDDFLDRMFDLRYQSGASARATSLKAMTDTVTAIVGAGRLPDFDAEECPLQLDLVVNAAELAALPFEAIADAAGQPLLVRRDRPIELTRRVRHEYTDATVAWPPRPRVLYVWASPPGVGKVPYEEHEGALRVALERFLPIPVGTDTSATGGVLTTVAEATIETLQEACAVAVNAKAPFTHVHILAHGYPVARAHRQRFGMALHTKDGDLDAVLPEAIGEALAPLRGHTVVVTLATCDAGNMTNTLVPEKSIAHLLHVAGFPVVVASQLPLTVPGSTVMVKRFYDELMRGHDVRSALHEARVALYDSRARTGHDWMAVVGYVRLPDTYADHLREVRLQAVLASLKNAQACSDKLVEAGDGPLEAFDRVATLLCGRIEDLDKFRTDPDAPRRPGVLEENLGLLGSAQKRLAELHFERGKRSGGEAWRASMFDALKSSLAWYRQGFERNLSHHWTGVQYLSLQSVLEGRIEDVSAWHAALLASRTAVRDEKEYWAYGSLAELYLLAPLAAQVVAADAADRALATMKQRVPAGDTFPLESTERQLRRYTSWWTAKNGFFPGRPDLAGEAERLIQVLRG